MDEHDPRPDPVVGERRVLVRWVQPTRGYVVAVAVTAVVMAAGVVWWLLPDLVAAEAGCLSSGVLSVAAMVIAVVGAVVMVQTARCPQPWVSGMRRRGVVARLGDRADRRVVRRAMWRGVLPGSRRLQHAAAIRMATAVADRSFLGLSFLLTAMQMGLVASLEVEPSEQWVWAIVGVLLVTIPTSALAVVAWWRRRLRVLDHAYTEDIQQRDQEPAR